MNINSALKKLKILQNELTRLETIRQEGFSVTIPKTMKLDDVMKNPGDFKIIPFAEITAKIGKLATEISGLKEQLQKTNVTTILPVRVDGFDGEITLARLKLMVDEFRSELKQMDTLKRGRVFFPAARKMLTSEDEEKTVDQLDTLEIEAMIKQLDDRKRALEDVLEKANFETRLVD
nr:hypothetical protein [Candidatus Sigynarchaeota archaeon]